MKEEIGRSDDLFKFVCSSNIGVVESGSVRDESAAIGNSCRPVACTKLI